MKKIRLFLDGVGWMSETDDQEVIELFGTGILPTPFLRKTKGQHVLETIKTLNPDAIVTLEDC